MTAYRAISARVVARCSMIWNGRLSNRCRFEPYVFAEWKELIDGEFVLRYEADDRGDGLPAGESAFLARSK
jgi:hypothetical protein